MVINDTQLGTILGKIACFQRDIMEIKNQLLISKAADPGTPYGFDATVTGCTASEEGKKTKGVYPGKVTMHDGSQVETMPNITESIDKRIDISLSKLQEAIRCLSDVKGNRCRIVEGIHGARACCAALLNLL